MNAGSTQILFAASQQDLTFQNTKDRQENPEGTRPKDEKISPHHSTYND